MNRNPLSYSGNKNKVLKEIMPKLSVCETFVDIFCGSGVVATNSGAQKIILNDINAYAIEILKVLARMC